MIEFDNDASRLKLKRLYIWLISVALVLASSVAPLFSPAHAFSSMQDARISAALPTSMVVTSEPIAQQSLHEPQSGDKYLAQVTVGTTPGRAIPAAFMGIAHEWGDAQVIMGSSDAGANLIYRNLLNNLTAYGSGPIVIRIGGNSTDTSKEPDATTVRPFAELANVTGAHFYLGVNLGAGNVQLAVDQAKAFMQQMPKGSVDAIEIGNEPDSYVDKGMRPKGYQFPDYLKEFGTWRQQVLPVLPANVHLLGPSWAYPASLAQAESFLVSEHSSLYGVSQHFYVGDVGNGKINPVDILLRATSSTDGPRRVQDGVRRTHSYNLPFRINELNSIAGGGQDGVSNTFGSALWSIDSMFEYVQVGVDGVNWQSPNGATYSALHFHIDKYGNKKTYAIDQISHLYYGMLFFQAAVGSHAHLMPVSVNTQTNIKAWATMDERNTLRVVLLNKTSQSGQVRICAPGLSKAVVLRLTAPAVNAKNGVIFAGQTLDGSLDGKLQGERTLEKGTGMAGNFQLSLPAGSAFVAQLLP